MTIAEDQARLVKVNAHIDAILDGAQHFAISDKQKTMARLEVLEAMRDRLETKIARAGKGILVTGGSISHD